MAAFLIIFGIFLSIFAFCLWGGWLLFHVMPDEFEMLIVFCLAALIAFGTMKDGNMDLTNFMYPSFIGIVLFNIRNRLDKQD